MAELHETIYRESFKLAYKTPESDNLPLYRFAFNVSQFWS
jgi:hypothetical protein